VVRRVAVVSLVRRVAVVKNLHSRSAA